MGAEFERVGEEDKGFTHAMESEEEKCWGLGWVFVKP